MTNAQDVYTINMISVAARRKFVFPRDLSTSSTTTNRQRNRYYRDFVGRKQTNAKSFRKFSSINVVNESVNDTGLIAEFECIVYLERRRESRKSFFHKREQSQFVRYGVNRAF